MFEKAFKQLFSKGSYKVEDLTEMPIYKEAIKQTADVFEIALNDNIVDGELKRALSEDIYIFSGLKTHSQLLEASRMLTTDEGQIKSEAAFLKDIETLNKNYNLNYASAEYSFAIASAQMADKWVNSTGDTLQYRTAFDERVRESHKVLHNITLPKDDPFWVQFYPPNGWRCRCLAIHVRGIKYTISNSKESIAKGEKATTQINKDGNNKLEIFRFNPGTSKVIFPPKHPYNKVTGANKVKEILKKDE